MAKQWKILREKIIVRLVNNAKGYKKYVSKSSFVPQKIFTKRLLLFMKLNQL